jgi:class 3 adenylate cyclase
MHPTAKSAAFMRETPATQSFVAAGDDRALGGFEEVHMIIDHAELDTGRDNPSLQSHAEYLVLALTHVPGSTAACAAHGDARTVALLSDYYALVAHAAASAGGRVVKVIGDGTLVTFPIDRVREAVETLRSLQAKGTRLWRGFDARCHVEVKVDACEVVCGLFGPPGDALNQLFKGAWGEFVLTPEVEALLQ